MKNRKRQLENLAFYDKAAIDRYFDSLIGVK